MAGTSKPHRATKPSAAMKKPTVNKGIRTDFAEVKSYITGLITYIIEEADQLDVLSILRNINHPLGPSSKEVLEYLSLREIGDESSSSSSANT